VQLTINGEEVSYSIESERTLGEIVHGVRAWLAAAGFIITGLQADDRDILEPHASSWSGTSLDAVKTLGVTAMHTGEMKVAHWRTVEKWLAMLEEELGKAPSEMVPEPDSRGLLEVLLEGLPQTLEGFAANPFLPPGSDAGKRFESTFAGQAAPAVRSWAPETRRQAVALIQLLRSLVLSRIHDATHPREALSRCAGLLRGSMVELKEVSLLLQTGRDKSAMDIVIRFTDTVQSLMDILPFLIPDTERTRLLVELTPVLRELVAAFGSRDSVLIGDLLEYEVAPRMEKIVPLLEKAV
jgi:hypothetical protein